jgi:hypothetical protein
MDTRIKNIFIGSLIAIVTASIIIFAVEEDKSFYQIAAGFFIFILPYSFISTFFSKLGSFIFVFISILIGFIVSRYYYYDFWIGVVLSAIIGGAIYKYITIPAINTMNSFKPFSPNDYKEKSKEFYNNNKKQS